MLDAAHVYAPEQGLRNSTLPENNAQREQAMARLLKRGFDVVGAGLLLMVLSLPMLLMAVVIAGDGGAPIYRQMRVGRNGKLFGCLKFRSMVRDADAVLARHLAGDPAARAEWAADHKLKNDPRITPIGRLLRKTSLDELPQFLNVLKGEMSLVGPRPIVAEEVEKYAQEIVHYYRVAPGITGLWQVSGRNDVSYDARVQMDSWYVRHWSLWRDMVILGKTLPALLNRSGAY